MVGEEFDQLHSDYPEKIRRWVPYYDQLLASLVRDLPAGFTPHNILDLGCGHGEVTQLAWQAFPDAEFVLVDASAKMIRTSWARFGDHERFLYSEMYFQEMRFMPSSFDLILAGLSLHHLSGPEKRQLFADALRWLRPGGILASADLHVDREDEDHHHKVLKEWEALARQQGSDDADWTYLMDHYNTYDRPHSFEQQLTWLQEAGFSETKIVLVRGAWGTIRARKT